MHNSISFDVA